MHKPLVLVFIGPPGSGKGTQAVILAQEHGMHVFTMGSFLREQSHKNTPDAQLLEATMKRGELVPDDLIFNLITHELRSITGKGGVVFDGFPRNLVQAQFLDSVLNVTQAIYFSLPSDVSIKRIAGRRLCPHGHHFNIYYVKPKVAGRCDFDGALLQQREDDMPATVATRLANDQRLTTPVLDFYKAKGMLATINADAPITDVATDIKRILDTHDHKK